MNNIFLLTAFLAGIETLALTSLTKYSKNKKSIYLMVGMLIYGIVIPTIIVQSLNFEGIGTVNFIWNIITTVSMIVVGYHMFNEKLNRLHMISLLLAIAALISLYYANKKI